MYLVMEFAFGKYAYSNSKLSQDVNSLTTCLIALVVFVTRLCTKCGAVLLLSPWKSGAHGPPPLPNHLQWPARFALPLDSNVGSAQQRDR
jgi:hypothetical protein